MSYAQRKIDLTILLGIGDFGEAGQTIVKLTGLRVRCSIQQTVGALIGQARLRIYGLTPSQLNQLSALNAGLMTQRQNKIIIDAGDVGQTPATIFAGTIQLGQIDLNSPPDSALNIMAVAGGFEQLKTIPPKSYTGTADAANIMRDVAISAGLGFENNGVSHPLATQYLCGSAIDQLNTVKHAANIQYTIENNTLIIWPENGTRAGAIPLISPATGMVGYPAFSTDQAGLDITTLFNPDLYIASRVQIESSLKVANGVWKVFGIAHDLESEVPGGQWFTHFQASPYVS